MATSIMLNPPDTSTTQVCQQCRYETQHHFQLDHHFRRQHQTVYLAELFHAIVEPELRCLNESCKFNTFYQLDLYEHCVQEHKSNVTGDGAVCEDHGYCEQFRCLLPGCQFKTCSVLLAVKHYAHCEAARRVPEQAGSPADDQETEQNQDEHQSRPQSVRSKRNLNRRGDANPSKRFQCAKCSFTTKYKSSLAPHMLMHARFEEIIWYSCSLCSHRAKRKGDLTKHMLKHADPDEIVWFNCKKCSYRAKQKSMLKSHDLLKHASSAKIKWNECDKCSYKTMRRTDLKKHTLIKHSSVEDIDWHKCDKCPFQAKHLSYVRRHASRVHASGKKIVWYECSKCDYQTKREWILEQHMLKHAGHDAKSDTEDVKWYKCKECQYKTTGKGNLNKHKLLVHADPEKVDWYKCAECWYQTKQKGHLARHALQHASKK